MDAYKLDREKLLKRLQKVTAAWSSPLDAIVVVTGKTSDEAQEHKAQAMHHYLLGIEFPETAIVLLKSGTILFFSSSKKIDYLRQVEGEGVVLLAKDDAAQMAVLLKHLQCGKDKATIGTLLKETRTGPWAASFLSTLTSNESLQVRECRDEISQLLAVQDVDELVLSQRAAFFAQLFMDKCVIKQVEEVIDKDEKKTNEEVCTILEQKMENEELMKEWATAHNLETSELDLVYVSVQSGKHFELKPCGENNSDEIPMEGTYVLSVGMKYAEYSGCISRTLLVDPDKMQKEAYYLALEVQTLVFACLKPGVVLKEIYKQAKNLVQRKKPDLLKCFVKSVGFAMGLEFKDPQMMLSEKSERKVETGMVFCISVGFAEADNAKPWAVWVSDTAHVLPADSQPPCSIPTDACTKKPSDVMYELGDPDAEAEQPAKAPVLPTKPPVSPKASKAKPKNKAASSKQEAASAKPAKKEKDRSKVEKEHKRSKEERRESYEAKEHKMSAAAEVIKKRRAEKMATTKAEIEEQMKLENENVLLREKKLKELQERYGSDVQQGSRNTRVATKLTDCKAYENAEKMPANLRPNRLQIDMNAEALLAPICGSVVPFHLRTIKNMARSEHETFHMLRVNFFTPGNGKSLEDYPVVNGQRVYVKELSFRSQVKDNLDTVLRTFKEMQKRAKEADTAKEVKTAEDASGVETRPLVLMRSFPCLRDITMRPSLGRGRTSGTLEAHTNGIRFSTRGGAEKTEILYSRIQHAIFQPCEGNSLLVVLHFHLKDAMMVGKRKSHDLQFLAEAGNLTEDLSKHKVGSAHDPDEILEEQREREWKERLNHLFLDFTKKVEGLSGLSFDMPLSTLSFAGVPFRQSVQMFPCADVLVSLTDWPPFCLDLNSIDIAVFERNMNQLKEFDLVFVLKDYDQPPIRITTIPSQRREVIKSWIASAAGGIPLYSCSMNMQWQIVMREINNDRKAFVDGGGWDNWFVQSDDEASASGSGEDVADDFGSDDISDDSASPAESGSGEDEWEGSGSDSEEDTSGESEPSDAESWDELERNAEKDDKKRDSEKLSKRSMPPAKRSRF